MSPSAAPVFALLMDGTTIEISEPMPADHDAVRAFFARLRTESVYRRFLGVLKDPGRSIADALCPPDDIRAPGHHGLLARRDGEILGVAEWIATGQPGEAEIAFTVGDALHHRGVATLLAEHLLDAARRGGTHRLIAYTQLDNSAMLGVFAGLGVPVVRTIEYGLAVLRISLEPDQGERLAYLEAVDARERRADEASLRHVLHPASVAVVGDGVVARALATRIRDGGFTGRADAVKTAADVTRLPDAPELAVLTTPPTEAAAAAAACGRAGVRALIVVSGGFDAVTGPALLAACRRYGMRLVGPDSLGIASTNPDVQLDATIGARHPGPGTTGLVVQSGGVGIALLEHLSQLGIGVSSVVSAGEKYDVSANDLLMHWENDGVTRLGLLYLDSFGNPRKFSRTARRVARTMPLLTVDAGRTPAGRRAGGPRITAPVPRRALFHQAGIIATHSLSELIDATALLAAQPLPAAGRVAILSNAGGPAGLAADACVEAGLTVPELEEADRAALAALLPKGATVANPVDTTMAVTPSALRAAARRLAACGEIDALILVLAPTALSDPRLLLRESQTWNGKPVAAVLLDQPEAVTLIDADGGRRIPAYPDPAAAATALGYARRYAAWLACDPGRPPDLPGIDHETAAGLVAGYLSEHPDGGRLAPADCATLLSCYGIPRAPVGPPIPVHVRHDEVFGPLIVAGSDNPLARLTPLTDIDAAELADAVTAPSGKTDTAALVNLLLRVSRLADDLPQISALTLDHAAADVELIPRGESDPYLRRLRAAVPTPACG